MSITLPPPGPVTIASMSEGKECVRFENTTVALPTKPATEDTVIEDG